MRSMLTVAMTGLIAMTLLVSSRTQTTTQPPGATTSPPIPASFGAVQPRLSPDGESVAFSYHGGIWRMPLAGGTMRRLTNGSGFDVEPAWSPDGSRIAFVHSPSHAAGALQIINSDSGQRVDLPKPIGVPGAIAYQKLYWHPNGRQLLGIFQSPTVNRSLAWYDVESGEVSNVAAAPRWGRYALSNDGRSIIYTTTKDVSGEQGGNNGPQPTLWQLPADGGEAKKLGSFPARIYDICFAPDDRSLFLTTDLGGAYYDLWNVPLVDGDLMARARQITFGQGDEHRPSVSADGRWLLFTDNRHNATSLTLRNLESSLDRSLSVSDMDFGQAVGTLKLATRDGATEQKITARVSIEDEDGGHHAPPGRLFRVLKDYAHFYCEGTDELQLPVGHYRMRVLHGPEYRTAYREFDVAAGKTVEVTVDSERWTNQPARGWYSGENHIHANYGYGEWYNTPESMLTQSAGENLGVSNFVVANSDGDGIFDRRFFRGRPDAKSTGTTILYWNQEFRSTIWGHLTLVNLSQLVEPIMTGFKDTTNPFDIPTNSDVAQRTHIQNGLVNYTHVAQRPDDPYENPYTGKSIPIDVALGNIDTLDLNASYAGTVPLWYRLLNCGFRLTASAGTDCFLNRIRSRLPGGDRVYVQLDGPLTYDKWIEGLRAGRSFVTNGPMLELTVDGKAIGDTIRLAGSGTVQVRASATTRFPFDRLELIQDGKVVATAKPEGEQLECSLDEVVKVNRSGWLSVRASGPGHRDHPVGTQYSHTSPIYLDVAGKPASTKADAEYFLKWIDRLHLAVRVRDRIPSDELKQHVEAQLDAAREVYRRLAE